MAIFVPRDRKSLFRQFLSGMYDAVVITDPNGHILEINKRAVEHFGYEPDEVLDRHVSLYIPRLTPEVVQRIRKEIADDKHVMIDANGCTKNGDKIACEVTLSVIDLMDPGDLVMTIRNVERRRAYMNAFKAKANAFEIAHVALFGCDMDGNIRDCNQAFLDLFGIADVEAARKRKFNELMSDDPLPKNFLKALNGEKVNVDIVAEDENGCSYELNICLSPNMHGRRNHGVVGSILKV